MQNHHHSHSGATRTEMLDSWRFTPYGGYSARPITHGTTVARPSTHIPLYIQHYAPPTIQPTGGLSETAANAEHNQTYTEEDESPVSDFYCSRIPHVSDRLLDVRQLSPDAPAGKGFHACTVSGTRRVPTSYGRGLKPRGDIGHSQAIRTP